MQQQQQQQQQQTAAVVVEATRPALARSRLENDSPNAPANAAALKRTVRPASGSRSLHAHQFNFVLTSCSNSRPFRCQSSCPLSLAPSHIFHSSLRYKRSLSCVLSAL
jgi:hypothetical protein